MVSVVVVIINIVFIIMPNPREWDHTFPGIWEAAGDVPGGRGIGSHLQAPLPCTRFVIIYPRVKFVKPE